MIMNEILDLLEKDGSVIINPSTDDKNPKSGYVIAVSREDSADIEGLYSKLKGLANPFHWIWIKDNPTDYSAGLAVHKYDLKESLKLGILNGEAFIYDCQRKTKIDLPEGQRSGTMTQRNTYAEMRAEALSLTVPAQL